MTPSRRLAGAFLLIFVVGAATITLLRNDDASLDEALILPAGTAPSSPEGQSLVNLAPGLLSLPPAATFQALSIVLAETQTESAHYAGAHYAGALAARDGGEQERALELFAQVVVGGGLLAPMAELRLAQLLASADRRDEAADAFARVIAAERLPASLQVVARTEAARNLARLGRTTEALSLLAEVESLPVVTPTQQASARWQATEIRREAGDPRWQQDAAAVMRIAPASSAAVEALDRLSAEGLTTANPMVAAQVNYRARRNSEAERLYWEALQSGALGAGEAANAWFYLGALAERRREPREALSTYARSLDYAPNGALADHALYWRGRIYEQLGESLNAAHEYDQIVARFPTSSFISEVRIRSATAIGLNGDPQEALRRLEAIAAGGGPATAAQAARWHMVFRTTFQAPATAALSPRDYHPAALWSLLDEDSNRPLPAAHYREAPISGPLSRADVAAIEEWLSGIAGPRPQTSVGRDDPLVSVGLALTEVGEGGVARALLRQAIAARTDEPYALLEIATLAQQAGLHDISMSAANRILGRVSPFDRLEAPKPLLRLAYPAPFSDELSAAVERSPLPPLLLLALVRQESAFNPEAVSHAGASGLAQVMPATGEDIARALGEPWSIDNLRDPATSLRYGAYYMALQLRRYEGDVLAALAAYNGGGGNASRWLRDQPFPGPDGYIHGVDFAETRLYFEHVLENYAWYRFAHEAADAPAIR